MTTSVPRCVIFLALFGSFPLTAACGNTDSAQSSASGGVSSVGGGTSTGASNNGGTSAGGAATSPNTSASSEYHACAALYAALCHRTYAECGIQGMTEAVCLATTRSYCPDIMFGDGSQVTVAIAEACASRWQNASCDDLAKGKNPSCGFPPGLKALRERCISYVECQTLACSKYAAELSCGTCIPTAQMGDVCGPRTASCASGTSCIDQTCQAALPTLLAPGATCELVTQCQAGYSCIQNECQPVLAVGQRCSVNEDCVSGAFCRTSNLTCTSLPTQGQLCPDTVCAPGLSCDISISPRACTPSLTIGQECQSSTTNVYCAEGLTCECSDTACSSPVCKKTLLEGEACDAPNTQCITGTQCTNGFCVGVASLGLYAAVCG